MTSTDALADRYRQARALLVPQVSKLVRNANPLPRWIGTTDTFTYLRETADGTETVTVDAATGHVVTTAEAADGAAAQASAPSHRPQLLVSPDGKRAVDTRDGNLWLTDLDAGEAATQLTFDGEAHHGYGVYCDGWKAAFIPRRRQGPQPPMESFWSPDSRRVIVTRIDQRHVAPYPLVETAPHDGSFRPIVHPIRLPLEGEPPVTIEWYAVDVEERSVTRLELPYDELLDVQQDMLAIRRHWFTADGSHLWAVAFGKWMQSAFMFDIDLETGEVRTVLSEHGEPRVDLHSTTYNPPNVCLVGDGAEVIWFSQRDGWGHLYRYDGRTGELLNQLTRGEWLVRDIVHVDEARGRLYFTAGGREGRDPYFRHLYRIGLDGSDLLLLSPEPVDHLVTSPYNDVLALEGGGVYEVVSPSGDYVVYSTSALDGTGASVIRRTSDASLVAEFEHPDLSAVSAAGYVPPEPFVVRSADGDTDVHGVIYKPADFDPQQAYPVVDCEYASPLTAVVPHNLLIALTGPAAPTPMALASIGFIVVIVDARGTAFRERRFSFANHGRLHVNGLDDHVAAIQQLAESRPWMDLDRVGLYGRSYGGYSCIRGMLEFPDFYKVGVAGAPSGSLHASYRDYHWTTFQGAPVYEDGGNLRPTPTAIPVNWAAADMAAQADRLKGKLQIVVAELDENALMGTVMQFVRALVEADKDVDLVYLPDTDHFFRPNPHATRRMTDYFVRHLMGVEPPSASWVERDAEADVAGRVVTA